MSIDVLGQLEKVSGVMVAAFGDRVLVGILIRLLDDVKPMQAYDYIINGRSLFESVPKSDWIHWKELRDKFKIKEIPIERVHKEILKRRPDIMGIIVNTPGGEDWFQAQVAFAKEKLSV